MSLKCEMLYSEKETGKGELVLLCSHKPVPAETALLAGVNVRSGLWGWRCRCLAAETVWGPQAHGFSQRPWAPPLTPSRAVA